jgi:PilZ domain-containing protein/head binding protein
MTGLTAGIIAKPEHAAALRKRLGSDSLVVLFSDSESLGAFDVLVNHPPKILALDGQFAATARGAALIARIKAEPLLQEMEVRVLIDDEDNVPLLLNQPLSNPRTALLQTSRPLERCGTRRAVRFPMDKLPTMVNGERGQLVDLSVSGAQVIALNRLRPGQPIRVVLFDGETQIRCRGSIAWSVALPVGPSVHYRAGVEFNTVDTDVLAAFCRRHGKHPDRTFG